MKAIVGRIRCNETDAVEMTKPTSFALIGTDVAGIGFVRRRKFH